MSKLELAALHDFLDIMDATRNSRLSNSTRPSLPQYNDFRKDWADYLCECNDNLYNS